MEFLNCRLVRALKTRILSRPFKQFDSVLIRQDYFELIPSRSNNLQPVQGLLGYAPRTLSGSDRLLHRPQCL